MRVKYSFLNIFNIPITTSINWIESNCFKPVCWSSENCPKLVLMHLQLYTHKPLGTHVILEYSKISQIFTIKKSKKISILVEKWQNVSDKRVVFFHFLVGRRVNLPSMSWIIYTCLLVHIKFHTPTNPLARDLYVLNNHTN